MRFNLLSVAHLINNWFYSLPPVMAKTLDSSEDEFIELEEDDGEIVVIKSVSQLLKEANVELERRQSHIDVLNKNLLEMTEQVDVLKRELAFYRQNGNCKIEEAVSQIIPEINVSPSTPILIEHTSMLLVAPTSPCPDEESLQNSQISDLIDDFDILSNDKSCQTDSLHSAKRVKHKATQTRFNKQPQSIFQGGSTETNSDERDDSQTSERSTTNRISLSSALGWPNAFKEVGLNMICHLKQTMDPFNMNGTLDGDAVIKDFENLVEGRIKAKNVRKSSCTSLSPTVVSTCPATSDGNGNQKTMVICPYCSEEMDSCCMQRHIQSMCGMLDIFPFY